MRRGNLSRFNRWTSYTSGGDSVIPTVTLQHGDRVRVKERNQWGSMAAGREGTVQTVSQRTGNVFVLMDDSMLNGECGGWTSALLKQPIYARFYWHELEALPEKQGT